MTSSSTLSLVDPVRHAEEMFLLSIDPDVEELAIGLLDLNIPWEALDSPLFYMATRKTLAQSGIKTQHPDVPGMVVRSLLMDNISQEIIDNTKGPTEADKAGCYEGTLR